MNNTLIQKYIVNMNKIMIKIIVDSRQQIDANVIEDSIKLENISRITSDGKSTKDIRCRIAQTKQVFFKK